MPASPKRRRPPVSVARRYTPTYATPARLVEVAFLLTEPRRVVTPREIAHRLDVDVRTVQRYLAALRTEIFNGSTHAAVLRLEDRHRAEIHGAEEDDSRAIPVTRIARAYLAAPGTRAEAGTPIGELLPVYLAFTVLRFLEGIVPRARVEALWKNIARGIGAGDALHLSGFARKFFAVPYAPKRYVESAELLAEVVDAVVRQHVLTIAYYGLAGAGKTHRFQPYTLAMYKGGLYVLGKSDRARALMMLSIDRIDTVETVRDADDRPMTFRYPADYSPEQRFEGVFGLIEGPMTDVELEILDAETEARLRERQLHASQTFVRRRGLPTLLRLRMRGTTELLPWILSHGVHLRVRKPASLRREIREIVAQMAREYAER